MDKPKYFKFSFPSCDPTGIAICMQGAMAICVMVQNNMVAGGK